jgi:microcystin degradation protein MlrC
MMDQFSSDHDEFLSAEEAAAQRTGARDSLLLSASVTFEKSAPVTVRVRNLSAGGMMAEHAGRVAIGDSVTVQMRGVGEVAGSVAWATDGRVGIAFDSEIDPRAARKPVTVVPRPVRPVRGRGVL